MGFKNTWMGEKRGLKKVLGWGGKGGLKKVWMGGKRGLKKAWMGGAKGALKCLGRGGQNEHEHARTTNTNSF